MSGSPRVGLIWAQAEGGVIGREGDMPWHVPEDLAHFKAVTLGSPVVMGRGTWDSLAPRYRPLPGRRNIVITRRSDWQGDGAEVASSVSSALEMAGAENPEWIWVIGGGSIFTQTLEIADRLEVTELTHPDGFVAVPSDVVAPAIDHDRFTTDAVDPAIGTHTSTSGLGYRFLRYERAVSA